MDTSLNMNENKTYFKYKSVVKKWERDFVKENGRVPSKYDIKEATHEVRYAYKYYFNMKSEILESSLMDISLDTEQTNITFSELDVSNALEMNSDHLSEESVFHAIPTADQIDKLMCASEKPQLSDRVWGNHLNKKKVEPKKTSVMITKGFQKNISSELFKGCTFNKRNPRKSLSSCKSKIVHIEEKNKTESQSESLDTKEIDVNISTEIKHNLEVNRSNTTNINTVNPIQIVMTKNISTVRNINPGWLSRCSDAFLLPNDGADTSKSLDFSQNVSVSVTESINHFTNTNMSAAYGLKNLAVCPLIPSTNDSCLSDFVENSESEAEQTNSKPNTYRKIRPVVKRFKLDNEGKENSIKSKVDSRVLEFIPEENSNEGVVSEEKLEKKSEGKKRKSAIQNKKKGLAKGKKNNAKSQDLVKESKQKTRSKKEYQKHRLTSDSECDENIKEKKVNTRARRTRKKNSTVSENKYPEDSADVKTEFENYDIGEEEISLPRFPIKSSVLKEINLVDGLAAALDIPEEIKGKSKKGKTKSLSEAEKMQKKIDDGSLNDNFVRINLEKKVYARGKKTMNFSKFKKQQWKNKKKMLHNTPEFPEGGILKCFKCNQPGHMSRYCTAGRGSDLLELNECQEEKSPYISLQDAELLKDTEKIPRISENIIYECIEKKYSVLDEAKPSQSSVSTTLQETHLIPESFIKLLSTPLTSTTTAKTKIEPVFQLLSGGMLIGTPKEVKEALNLFGHDDFRNGQEVAVMRILSGLSTLVTLSTGSGKSLCYQLPAYLYAQYNKCITLVISPLVSLMEDQVTSMPDFLHAACLHTNQSPTQREKIIDLIKNGNIHILLISPEAIVAGEKSTGFGAILRQLPPIAFACIDEVHCVSQWSHNFRPSYLMICRVLREKMGVNCVLGLTATATKPTINEIVQHLEITDGIAGVITNKPLPDNLILTVSRDSQRDHYLLELLESERFSQCKSVIVYCIRRDECERVASLIRSSMQGSRPTLTQECQSVGNKKRKRFSWIVESYHAGMSAAKRRKVQQAFMSGELRIVVATVAFGMGINKSDIRGVIHYNMPGSFESYVQEVGRAGRDGLPAHCHVFIDRESKDRDELLRHIHANSIERHVIRKLLQKVFLPCGCTKMMNNESTDGGGKTLKCRGHEVAFSVDETVSELDIPSENIATLLCYLELHSNKFAKVLSNVYIMCKIISYGGPAPLLKAAEKCPPLAMALALQKNRGVALDKNGILEFCVIEVAAAIGWESGVVKYHLKNLEWDKQNGLPKKSLLRVEFNTLGFRVKSPGDLTSTELDAALDSLFERTQLQEKTMLHQLQEVSKALFSVSFPSIFQCSLNKDEITYTEHSNQLKEIIRNYFARESSLQSDLQLDERPVNKEQVTMDVRGLLATYRDCTFTGRAVARILQGISSPNFPAIVWGRCRYWRSHISADFYKLVDIGKKQIISMR